MEKRDWRDITRLYPYDLTRSDEYQGRLNRFRVGMQVVAGVAIAVIGVAWIVVMIWIGSPLWAYLMPAGYLALGGFAAGFWLRSYRRSVPPRSEDSSPPDGAS